MTSTASDNLQHRRAKFRGLHVDAERRISIVERTLPTLRDREVRVRTEFASIKHGTEFHNLSPNAPFVEESFDPQKRLFVPRDEAERRGFFAAGFAGNSAVGTVEETGAGVTAFQPGDRVYGYAPVCDVLNLPEERLHSLREPMTSEDAVCLDPALYALSAVRDSRACLGDTGVVFGLGAIGLLVVQMLRKAGCLNLIVVDPVDKRRNLALRFGPDAALDPAKADVAVELRKNGPGADYAIEASGSYHALRDALRSVRPCGRIVTLGYYKGAATDIELSKEWMHNRLELISSMPTWGNPPRDYPLWTEDRLVRTVEEMFVKRVLTSEGLLDPIVDFADSARAYEELYRDASNSVKLGIRFPC